MFLSSFEKLRAKIQKLDIVNMAHLGARAFEEIGGEVVQTTSFVFANKHVDGYKGTYCRLVEPTTQQGKEEVFLAKENRYVACSDNFAKIPGAPVAYWVSENVIKTFEYDKIGDVAKPRQGLATGCNDIFLRYWDEVDCNKINFAAISIKNAVESAKKWFPYNKGGDYRKWYGNNEFIVNWEHDGNLIRNFKNEQGKLRSRPQNTDYYFKESFSWSLITSGGISFRYKPNGFIFDVAGMSCFTDKNLEYFLALCNTPVVDAYMKIIAPTINYQAGDIAKIPVIFKQECNEQITALVKENISFSKSDWDAFETSWDFKKHPLI